MRSEIHIQQLKNRFCSLEMQKPVRKKNTQYKVTLLFSSLIPKSPYIHRQKDETWHTDSPLTHVLRVVNILKALPFGIIKTKVLPGTCVAGWEGSDKGVWKKQRHKDRYKWGGEERPRWDMGDRSTLSLCCWHLQISLDRDTKQPWGWGKASSSAYEVLESLNTRTQNSNRRLLNANASPALGAPFFLLQSFCTY